MAPCLEFGDHGIVLVVSGGGDVVGQRHVTAPDQNDFNETAVDHGILLMLRNAPAGLTMGHLAAQFGTEASVITYRIKRMEGRGLAIRHRDRGDGRLVAVHITAAGEFISDAAGPVHVASVRRHFMDHVPRSALPVMATVFSDLYGAQHET